MDNLRLTVNEAIQQARAAKNNRHTELVVKDGPLRQAYIAMTEGTELAKHNSPPAASILVALGAVRVFGKESHMDLEEGDLASLTHEAHSVRALEDSVFLLTTVTSQEGMGSHP